MITCKLTSINPREVRARWKEIERAGDFDFLLSTFLIFIEEGYVTCTNIVDSLPPPVPGYSSIFIRANKSVV